MFFKSSKNIVVIFGFLSSYAEVRAERRRELGIEESLPEITADKVSDLYNFILPLLSFILKIICKQIHSRRSVLSCYR